MFDFAFNSFYEAIYMNGHGIYVWSVVLIVCMSLLVFFILYSSKIKQIKKKLDESN
jgi:heme exporter protein D